MSRPSYLQSWLVSKFWVTGGTDPKLAVACRRGAMVRTACSRVGIHILDFASYGAALDIDHVFCALRAFDKAPGNRIGEYDLTPMTRFAMTLDFANGAFRRGACPRWATGHMNELRLRILWRQGRHRGGAQSEGSALKACIGDNIETRRWENRRPAPCRHYQRFDRGGGERRADRTDLPQRRACKSVDLAVVSDESARNWSHADTQ